MSKGKLFGTNDAGFTMVELVVALSLVGILFLFSLRFLTYINAEVREWNHSRELDNQATQIFESVLSDCENSGFIVSADSVKLRFTGKADAPIYTILDHDLYRDNMILTPEQSVIDTLVFNMVFVREEAPDTTIRIHLLDEHGYPEWIVPDTVHYRLHSIILKYQLSNEIDTVRRELQYTVRPQSYRELSPSYVLGTE